MAAPSLQSSTFAVTKSLTNHIEFNYSELKRLIPVNGYVSSSRFCVGGYYWALDFYPNNLVSDTALVSFYLCLLSEAKEVHAEYSLNVLDKMGNCLPVHEPIVGAFSSNLDDCNSMGFHITKDKLEARYCKDGMLVISFNVKVLSAPSEIIDCSNWLYHDIKKLWRSGERFDVTFEVEGERISGHRFMLAARSPVLEAELYGHMTEAKSSCIKIKDMKAKVFKALLCFIYTDNFGDRELEDLSVEFVQDLFIAADRYALEILKVQCQQRLWVALCVDTALSTLILAERHSSAWLKEKCLDFASKSENFTELALTEEYVQMMQSFPSLLVELRQKVKNSSDSVSNVAKKQKTV